MSSVCNSRNDKFILLLSMGEIAKPEIKEASKKNQIWNKKKNVA